MALCRANVGSKSHGMTSAKRAVTGAIMRHKYLIRWFSAAEMAAAAHKKIPTAQFPGGMDIMTNG
jgi:hypothetical protein